MRHTCLLAALLATTACSQNPAVVEMKGLETFGRSGTSFAATGGNSYRTGDYSHYAPAAGSAHIDSSPVVQASSASVQSIGVSELPSPKTAKPVQLKTAAETPAPARINPWTRRARLSEGDEQSFNIQPAGKTASHPQMAAEVSTPREVTPHEKTVAQLDSAMAKPATASFMWPVTSKKVISSFGPKGNGKVNDGINIAAANGEPVWAAADGEVVYTGNELAGYGNMVLIKHTGGKSTTYAHLSRITVNKYERVKQGDIIGYVGATGNAKKPQLHFAIRDGKEPLDPQKYLSTKVAGL